MFLSKPNHIQSREDRRRAQPTEMIIFVTIILDIIFILELICCSNDQKGFLIIIRYFCERLQRFAEDDWKVCENPEFLPWLKYLCALWGYQDVRTCLCYILEALSSISNTEDLCLVSEKIRQKISSVAVYKDEYLKQLGLFEDQLKIPKMKEAGENLGVAIKRFIDGIIEQKKNDLPDRSKFDVLEVLKLRNEARVYANELTEKAKSARCDYVKSRRLKFGTPEETNQVNEHYKTLMNIARTNANDATTKAKELSRLLMQLLEVPISPWRPSGQKLGSRYKPLPSNQSHEFARTRMNIEISKILLRIRNTMMFIPIIPLSSASESFYSKHAGFEKEEVEDMIGTLRKQLLKYFEAADERM